MLIVPCTRMNSFWSSWYSADFAKVKIFSPLGKVFATYMERKLAGGLGQPLCGCPKKYFLENRTAFCLDYSFFDCFCIIFRRRL